MVKKDELRIEAVPENVRRVGEFVRGVGRGLGLSEDALFDIELAVEEATTNIVRHAYGSDRAGDILLRLEVNDEWARITLTDWGLPFKAEDRKSLNTDAPVETRVRGGMGLHLIHRVMDVVTRTTASTPGGANKLTLCKRKGK